MNINEEITDSRVLSQYYILRDGYEFKPLTHPANIYDALVIKSPPEAICEYPKIVNTGHPLYEQIDIVNRYKLEKAIVVADNISFIAKCPTLKHIEVIPTNDSGNGFDFSPLYEMSEIKTLCCRTEYGIRKEFSSRVDYAQIKGIESLSISGKGHINYSQIETLKTFGISGYRGVDLTNLFSSKVLDTLLMIQCKIQTLDGIQQSNRMQCLYLYNNRSLQDISALKKVKRTLRALRIENCPKISDFSVLNELYNLELLALRGANTLSDLSFIKNMPKLKTLILEMNVLDGNLSMCKDLQYVYVDRIRKHYNVKEPDLPRGEYIRGNESIEEWRRLE